MVYTVYGSEHVGYPIYIPFISHLYPIYGQLDMENVMIQCHN